MSCFRQSCIVTAANLLIIFAGASSPARAQASAAENKLIVNNPDDREDSIPTNWWIFSHQTPLDITNTINAQNARIIDWSVERFTPSYLFTVTYVRNAGPYFKGWWWYYGRDATTLANDLATNNARLISLKAYDIGGGQIRFAAVMVQNTGKDNKGWWWYFDQTPAQIASNLAANNARLIQINSYVTGGQTRYAVVMISNTGNDNKAFWWYTDITAAQVDSFASTNNARVTDLDYIAADGKYNAIMVSCAGGCPAWSTAYGQTANQMLALTAANQSRLIDTNSYPGCGDLCFSFVTIDDSLPPLDSTNPITSRVGQLLRAGGVTGVQGLYLKPVGGPVLANLENSFVYEPASSIKVLPHLYALTQVQNGAATLSMPVTHYTNGPASCPDPATVSGTETLSTALQEMMWHSDNARTREMTDTFGDPNINSFGSSIGMLNTRINQIIGCGGPIPDQLTLDDAGKLYEGVANGSRLTAVNRATFYSLMAGKAQFQVEAYDWTHLWDTDFPNIIAQSAPGTTTAQQQAYKNQMNLAYKAGSYVLCDSNCSNVAEYLSITGVAEIPFCSGPSTTLQDYVFGIYLHGAIDSSWFSGKNTAADQNFNAAKAETLREQIVNGLASCGLAPATVTVTAGNNQSVSVNTAFAALSVTVKDANNSPVPNAVVTFTAPSTAASGTFGAPCSGVTCMVTANASGVATAPAFTANSASGPYSVTASFNGHTGAFTLANISGLPPCASVQLSASPVGTAAVASQRSVGVSAGQCSWSANSNAAWIHVQSGASGSGNGVVQLSIDPNSGLMRNGTVTIGNQMLLVIQAGTDTKPPFGVIDTPANGATGQAGAINFTGWALSSITLGQVALCREPVAPEASNVIDPHCLVSSSPTGLVYMTNALMLRGVRPDVASSFPAYPNNNWGWGAQILTNFLPGMNGLPLGNGTYKLHAIAADPSGLATDFGTTTISVNNAASILPFGTIDTPAQGETISGTDYVNFGWVLTAQPNIVPINGSTITVHIDGVAVGHPTYNNLRSDIATLFPGLRNSNGGVGFFHIDTTKLSNGIHTIDWVATDSALNAGGLGSRYFFVQN